MAVILHEGRRGPLARVREAAAVLLGVPMQELIGRYQLDYRPQVQTQIGPTVDGTRPDYEYFDKLRRGQEASMKIGGLFADPITGHKKNWTLGRGFKAKTGHAKTDEALEKFIRANLRMLKDTYKNGLDLGDAYIIVNSDGTLSEAAPDTVKPVHDPFDYRTVQAYIVSTRGEQTSAVDEYRADKRIVTITAGNVKQTKTFKNLIGRLTVCHYANRRSTNEVYGHPEIEPMLPAMMDYDDVYQKGSAGVKAMSGPMPALENVTDPQTAMQALGGEMKTFRDKDGTTNQRYVVDFKRLMGVVTTGQFNYKGPAPFTEDMWRVLKNLFYLMLQNSNVPEFIWGGAIQGSKASVEAQMPGWTAVVEDQRSSVEQWLAEICEVWLSIKALADPAIKAAPVEIDWPEVTIEGKSELRAMIELLLKYQLITDETALRLAQMVDDPEAEIKRVQDAAQARKDDAAKIDQWAIDAAAGDEDEDEQDSDEAA